MGHTRLDRALRAWLHYEGELSYEKQFVERVRLAAFGSLTPINEDRARELEELAAEADDEPIEVPATEPPAPSQAPRRLSTPPADQRERVRTLKRRLLSSAERQEHREAEREVAGLRAQRPRTRGDCEGGQRPCPWISCRHHLYLTVGPTGAIKLSFPHLEVWEMPETCSLDVADRRGETLEEVGGTMNLTRARIEQVEAEVLERLRGLFPGLRGWLPGGGEE
jgi:hypothetical protein